VSGTSLRPLVAEDRTGSLVDRYTLVAQCAPQAVAVVDGDTSLTYGELDRRSNALAQAIVDQLDSQSGLVATVLDQDATAIVAILGILKAGCPYTFLDLTMPMARLVEISGLAHPVAFVADSAHRALADDLSQGRVPVIALDAEGSDTRPEVKVGPDDIANVVFTSGSTGQPKGVIVPHGAYLDHAHAATVSMDFHPEDRMGLVLPVGFAAAALYLHRGLATGAEIHLYDPRRKGIDGMSDWLRRQRITYLDFTPTMMRAFVASLDKSDLFEDVRVVTTAGEAVYGVDVGSLAPHLPRTSSFINHAGSSETSGYAVYTVAIEGPIPEGQVPSGTALGERVLSLRRDDGTAAGDDEPGELCVTSRYISLGYWGQPEQTAQRFEALADGRRCFRTGDQAVRRSDGVFEHRGRLDQMVKVRGYLVEPSEVEAALLATGEVAGAAVLGLAEPGVPTRLVAYVVPGGPETSAASVRRALRQKVPTYMVPTSVVLVADLPRNANGKIDRVGLLDLPVPAAPPPVQPRDHIELQLVVAWTDILGVDSVGVHDDFFELGGDSLAAEAAMAALCEDFGLTLPTSVLLEAPTVAELAVKVRDPSQDRARSTLVALRTTGNRPPLFCVSGVGALAVTYLPLSLHLGTDQPLYVMQNQGLENRGLPDFSMKGAARRAIRTMRSVQPTGPYFLAGHSWGGVLAFEIARQLTATGDGVAFLGLLDVTYEAYPDEALDDLPADHSPATSRVPSDSTGVFQARLSRLRGQMSQLGVVCRVFTEALSGAPRTKKRVEVFSRYGNLLMHRYRRTPWRGPATVILADDRSDGLTRMAWEGILLETPRRCTVPGDHKSMLREPNATVLAQVLSEGIDAALGIDPVELAAVGPLSDSTRAPRSTTS
jgi:amino acid adenylation domain-containing protein